MKINLKKRRSKILKGVAILFLLFIFVNIAVNTAQAQEDYEFLWSYETGGNVNSVSISADGSHIAVGGGDNKVYLLSHDGTLFWSYETDFPITEVSISADGSYIAAGGAERGGIIPDGSTYLFNKEGERLWNLDTNAVSSVSISADGSHIAYTYMHGLGWWDVVVLYSRDGRNYPWYYTIGESGTGAVSLSRDGKYTAVGSAGQGLEKEGIRLYNKEGKLLWNYEEIDTGYTPHYSVAISADGSYIIAGNDKNDKVYLLDRDGKLLWCYVTGHVEGVSISSDGRYITVGSSNKIYLLNHEGKLLWCYETESSTNDISVSADGNSIIAGLNNKVYFFQKLQIAAQNAIKNAHDAISQEKSKGVIVEGSESLLSQAETVFDSGDYRRAKELAEQSESKALELGKEANDASSSISKAKSAISQVKSKVFIVDEPESLLSQAEEAFNSGDYGRAKELADQSESKALEIDKEADDASSSISRAKSTIPQVKSKGFIVAASESLLSQAEDAFNTGDYRSAKELADESYALAIDIDQDGVINEKDFAPYINNYYIYAGVAAALFIMAITIKGSLNVRRKEKKKKRDIEYYRAKIEQWKREGYDVSELEEMLK